MKKRKDKREVFRLPRLMGITHLMREYHKSDEQSKPEIIKRVQDFIIQQWFMNNGVVAGVPYNIYQLSNFINCPVDAIQIFMRDRVLATKIWDKDKQEEILNGILGYQLSWVIEDRMDIQAQVDILKRSQGNSYVPFVSGELNKALKLKMDSSASIQAIVRNFMGGGTTNIFAQFNQQNNLPQEQGMTRAEAIEIINENQQSVPVDKTLKYLEDNYDMDDLPQVVATKQIGVDSSKEGLDINAEKLTQVTDNYRGSLLIADEEIESLQEEISAKMEDPDLDLTHNDRGLMDRWGSVEILPQ